MGRSIDILIKSYIKDFWLLQLALRTILKNVSGYRNLILLIPENDKEQFDTRELPERTVIHYVNEEIGNNGYMFQQLCKLKAFEYSDADFIMFSDSDCFFTYPINLQDFIKDDKPEILYTAWEKVGDAITWREPTERFLKEPVEWEMMRRNCLIYHRSTLIALSEFEPDMERIVMASHSFSEFNVISSFAYKNEKEKYTFVNTDGWEYTAPKAVQVWSHASKEKGADELHLREYIKILETILRAFDIPVP